MIMRTKGCYGILNSLLLGLSSIKIEYEHRDLMNGKNDNKMSKNYMMFKQSNNRLIRGYSTHKINNETFKQFSDKQLQNEQQTNLQNQNILKDIQNDQNIQCGNKNKTQKIQKNQTKQHTIWNQKRIDYQLITQQNKTFIQLLKSYKTKWSNLQQQIPFQSLQSQLKIQQMTKYVGKKLITTKYFYGDIVNVTCQLMDLLSIFVDKLPDKINNTEVNNCENSVTSRESLHPSNINMTESESNQNKIEKKVNNEMKLKINALVLKKEFIHLILYTYHLFPKQVRPYIQCINTLILDFINSCNLLPISPHYLRENMQLFFYLKKFIESEVYYSSSSSTLFVAQLFCQLLNNIYSTEKQQIENLSTIPQNGNNINFLYYVASQVDILSTCTILFPNVWIFNFTKLKKSLHQSNINPQIQNCEKDSSFQHQTKQLQYKISPIILTLYDHFVDEFNILFYKVINQWMNNHMENQILTHLPNNFSYKNQLNEKFKKQKFGTCINQLLVVFNRLHSIIQMPKLFSSTQTQNNFQINLNKKLHQKQIQKQNVPITQKYLIDKLNILKSLPNQTFQINQQIKFMRLLIFLKKILGYHTLRKIQTQSLAIYLQQLFERNNQHMINSKNTQKRRDIKYILGQLISRLTSGNWYDVDDRLGKYLSYPNYNSNNDQLNNVKKSFNFNDKFQ